MTLTVTPGGPADDSLVTLAYFTAYCDARGRVLGGNTASQEAHCRIGTTFVEGLGGPTDRLLTRWPGVRTSATQRRAWPRTGAALTDGTAIDPATIPLQIQDAVCEAAWADHQKPDSLSGALTLAKAIKSSGAGPVKVEFFGGESIDAMRPTVTAILDLLADVLVPDLTGPRVSIMSVGP